MCLAAPLFLAIVVSEHAAAGVADADSGADSTGTLTPEIVAAAVKGQIGSLQRCYEQSLHRHLALQGKLGAVWTIDVAGKVTDLHWEANEIGDPAFTACARGVLRQLQFSPAPAHPVEVSFPFVFTSDGVRADASHQWNAIPTAGETPEEVALIWLDAIRWADVSTIRAVSAYPLAIEGFNLESGSGREACKGTPRSDGIAGVRSFHAVDGLKVTIASAEDVDRDLQCPLADMFLRDDIPRANADGTWPQAPRNNDDHVSGTVRVVKAGRLSRHLARYRAVARRLAKDHTLVEATMTDNDGELTSVLLALRPDPERHFLVEGAYIDELFQE